MKNLELVKAERFGEVEADIYSNGKEMFMTIGQLAACLEYADKKSVENLIDRNPYLRNGEFSFIQKVPLKLGGTQDTRTFTEDGIYEVTMLSKQPKAREFRAWIRGILKTLRRGEATITPMTDYQQKNMEARERNLSIREQEARVKKARMLKELSQKYSGTSFAQILDSYATKELEGSFLIPLPELPEKTYSADEIGAQIGISANMVGRIANRYNLKTEQYGKWFKDKARGADKEVSTFRHFGSVIPVIEELAKAAN